MELVLLLEQQQKLRALKETEYLNNNISKVHAITEIMNENSINIRKIKWK